MFEDDGEYGRIRVARAGQASVIYVDNVPRVPFTPGKFHVSGRDLPIEPSVLQGCTEGWPAVAREGWSVKSLAERCAPDALFAVDGGPGFARETLCSAQVTMRAYLEYASQIEAEAQADGADTAAAHSAATGTGSLHEAAPLYIFDPLLAVRTFADGTRMRDEFAVADCFSQDTQAGCHKTRPLPPVWLLVGVQGSGTPIHDHPTTVSNHTLLCGMKLWVMLPPDVDESFLLLGSWRTPDGSVRGNDCGAGEGEANGEEAEGDTTSIQQDADLSAMDWLLHWTGQEGSRGGPRVLPASARVAIQRPGDTVFVPAGWWHVVLNVQTSTAISHSLALRRDFERVWPALKASECDAGGAEDTFAAAWAEHVAQLDAGTRTHQNALSDQVPLPDRYAAAPASSAVLR